jgi:hypothetical protein
MTRKSPRLTSISQWIAEFEWEPTYYSKRRTKVEMNIESASNTKAKTRAEERKQWRRVAEPSPSPEVDKRKRKR